MFTFNSKLAGEYRLTVRRTDGSIRHRTLWQPNIITTLGLDFPGKYDDYLGYCHVGTGTAAAVVGDVALDTYLEGVARVLASPVASAQGSAPYYGSRTFTYTFASGQIGANTVTEVGVGRQLADGQLFSRIVLSQSIPMLADEILDVEYTLRCYPDHLTATSTTVDIQSVTYDVDILAASVSDSLFWGSQLGDKISAAAATYWGCWDSTAALGAVTGTPSGVYIGGCTDVSDAVYSDGSFYRDSTVHYGTGDGNDAGGIGAMTVAPGYGRYQLVFSTPIPKTNLLHLYLSWRQAWARKTI